MKYKSALATITLLLPALFFFAISCETEDNLTNSKDYSLNEKNQKLDISDKDMHNLSTEISYSGNPLATFSENSKDGHCCNNSFPPSGSPNSPSDMYVCENDEDEIKLKLKYCAMTWAKYNPTPNSPLGYKACGGSVPWTSVPNIKGLTKLQQGSNPYFTWNFMYCHKYKIEKKIGDGSWSFYANIEPSAGYRYPTKQNFIDTHENLNTITQSISYRVRGDIFGEYSSGGPVIIYNPTSSSISVSISGPSSLKSGQSGTFTANVSDGTPPYSYSWKKYQYCDNRSQTNVIIKDEEDKSIPCDYWRPTGTNSKTLYSAGFPPKFKLKVTVTDNSGSGVAYKTMTVTPW